MYRIIHPMNNNVALVQNELQQELIVIGSGIAFGKKKNDLVADDKVEKVFRLNTDESRENFMALLKNVPLDFITTTYEVIDTLSKKYAYPVQEYIYVTSFVLTRQFNREDINTVTFLMCLLCIRFPIKSQKKRLRSFESGSWINFLMTK